MPPLRRTTGSLGTTFTSVGCVLLLCWTTTPEVVSSTDLFIRISNESLLLGVGAIIGDAPADVLMCGVNLTSTIRSERATGRVEFDVEEDTPWCWSCSSNNLAKIVSSTFSLASATGDTTGVVMTTACVTGSVQCCWVRNIISLSLFSCSSKRKSCAWKMARSPGLPGTILAKFLNIARIAFDFSRSIVDVRSISWDVHVEQLIIWMNHTQHGNRSRRNQNQSAASSSFLSLQIYQNS